MDIETELLNTRSALRQARTAVPKMPLAKKEPERAVEALIEAVEHLYEAVAQLAKHRPGI